MIRPERPVPLAMDDLLRDRRVVALDPVAGVSVTGVAARAQAVRPGDLFVALPGRSVHGAGFAAEALARGAVAVLTDAEGLACAAAAGLPRLLAEDPRRLLGVVAARVLRTDRHRPALYGVTGTNGKTTTVHLLERVLERLGTPTGVSSTVERGFGDERVESGLTTPEADELHALLARMAERGVRAAAVEVSAQALARSRVAGLVFDVAGFTNLSHDHLDDFGTMERYLRAKEALFASGTSRRAVVSLDSPAGRRLVRRVPVPVVTLTSRVGGQADWRVVDVVVGPHATRFTLRGPCGVALRSTVEAIGAHQAANAALAIVMAVEGGYPAEQVANVLDGQVLGAGVPGRLERLPGAADPSIYLDVAHTPDALATALTALRRLTAGRLVVVFGADGDRDDRKRRPMGRTAAELADVVVVHDHHVRTEDPDRIRRMVLDGVREGRAEVHEVRDPSAAIRVGLDAAGPGGTVLWAGTGRTAYRDVEGVKHPYSFWDEARRAAAERSAAVPA